MGCDFTEEVSLLLDGELAPREAVRVRAHVEGCALCKQSRDAFLFLQRELRSYDPSPDPHTQSKALASILGSRAPGRAAAAAPQDLAVGQTSGPRATGGRVWERLAEAFGGRRLGPAHAAMLALLLIVCALGVRWVAGPQAPSLSPRPGAPPAEDANRLAVRPAPETPREVKSPEGPVGADEAAVYRAEKSNPPRPAGGAPDLRGGGRVEAQGRRGGHRAGRRGWEVPAHNPRQEVARTEARTDARTETRTEAQASQPAPAVAVVPPAVGGFRASAADPSLRVGLHAERVERLFRSFRNARLTEDDPTLGMADARRLSKRLLYANIALRREAASAGDSPAEGLLDSLEPILLDISNLPGAPSPDGVGSIKERIRRRQLVGVLQARGMLASR